MSEIDKARDAAWDAAHGSYDSNRDYFDVGFAAGLAAATAKIEALEANLSAAASLADLARDVSDVFEPANKREALASDKLREALEAFEALEQENTDA